MSGWCVNTNQRKNIALNYDYLVIPRPRDTQPEERCKLEERPQRGQICLKEKTSYIRPQRGRTKNTLHVKYLLTLRLVGVPHQQEERQW